MTYNTTQQAYGVAVGTTPTNYPHIDIRDPNANDTTYSIGRFWMNTQDMTLWYLNNFTSTGGYIQANWILVEAISPLEPRLEGDSGGPVSPNGSGITFLTGSDGIAITGDAGSNTLTWSFSGSTASSYVTDSGTAIPSAGVLNVSGGTGINTEGSGNTVTLNADGTVPLEFTTDDTNTAIPSANNLNVFGGTGIQTSSSMHTVTIAVDGSVVGETITGNSGGALSPTTGNWNIVGTGDITTTGSGSTLTISSTGNVAWIDVTAATQTRAVNVGYTANRATLITFTLPSTAAYGSTLKVLGKGSGGWKIAQNAGQTIVMGSASTTAGVTGSISSSNQYDAIELICTVADTTFTRFNKEGHIEVV